MCRRRLCHLPARGSAAARALIIVLLAAVVQLVVPSTAEAYQMRPPGSVPLAYDYDSPRIDVACNSATVIAARFTGLGFSAGTHNTYDSPRSRYATNTVPTPAQAQQLVVEGNVTGSAALKSDAFHRAPAFVVDDIAENATVFRITGGDGVQRTLIQMPGGVDGMAGRFEWIIDDFGNLTHQLFVKGGSINGIPITP